LISIDQQTRRWLEAGAFDALVADLRLLLRLQAGRQGQPSAVILDSRTMPSTPESGARAGYDGHKRRKGSKVPAAVDTLGQLLALQVTPANEQDRAQVGRLAAAVQEAPVSPWPSSTRATPAPTRRRLQRRRASNCRS
jgi:DDE family transposase